MQTGDSDSVQNEAIGAHLLSCYGAAKHSFSNHVKMPWERTMQGPYDKFLEVRRVQAAVRDFIPEVVESVPHADSMSNTLHDTAFKKAGLKMLRACDERLWTERLSDERKAAIRKWTTLVSADPMSWDIAVQHFSQGPMIFASGGLTDSIKDSLVSKASSTLHARANPLFRFVVFCNGHLLRPWPVKESTVYDFLKSDQDFAPTFPRSFLNSISFAHHVLGLKGDIDKVLNGRTKGVSHEWFMKKRKLVQKPPLSVAQLKHLEHIVVDESWGQHDRIAAGFFLFATYSRARYTDALHVSNLQLDITLRDGMAHGWLEAEASRTKTSTNLEKKTRLLPMSAPVRTLTEGDWSGTWMRLRREVGLVTGEGKPLLPAPQESGGWAGVPLSASSAGVWLRALLEGTDGPPVQSIGTHSMKCTMLSWCAKYGLDIAVRRALGYHTSSADKSVNIYARDCMSTPLRELQKVIDAVANEDFMPDETRSGFFRDGDVRNHNKVPVDDIDSSSESSQDEECKDQGRDEAAIDRVAGRWQCNRETSLTSLAAVYFRHQSSRCIHILLDESGAQFSCGRRISTAYERLPKAPAFAHPLCSTCEQIINRNRS